MATELREGVGMSSIVSYGTVDGQPAKIVYYPERGQKQVYWGGLRYPDDTALHGHNHMTIQDKNPNTVHYLRVGNTLVVNHSYDPQKRYSREERVDRAKYGIAAILRDSLRRALRMYGIG